MKELLAVAYANVFDTVVAGVRCVSLPMDQPWGTQARPIAPVADFGPVLEWLAERSPQWTVAVPSWLADRPEYAGLKPWVTLPMYVLDGTPEVRPIAGVEIGPARDRDEFLSVFGVDYGALVTPEQMVDPANQFLVARLDGTAIGCAKAAVSSGTAYLSAVNVLIGYRGMGIGSLLSTTASRWGAERAEIVWLHSAELARPLYERLGYRLVGEHVLLINT